MFNSKRKQEQRQQAARGLKELSDRQFAMAKQTSDPMTEVCARSNAIAAEMRRRGLEPGSVPPRDLQQKYDWAGIRAATAAHEASRHR